METHRYLRDNFVLITMGDPAGIGLYLTLSAWSKYKNANSGFCVLANDKYLQNLSRYYNLSVPIQRVHTIKDAMECWKSAKLPVINICDQIHGQPAKPSNGDVPAILKSIETGVNYCMDSNFAGSLSLLTNPICKNQLYKNDFHYGGQTEYLAALCGMNNKQIAMIFLTEKMITMPLTYHVAVSEISQNLNKHMMRNRIKLLNRFLQQHKKIFNPRLALMSLNPHCGEDGYCGMEEKQILNPLVLSLQNQGIDIIGVCPMETLFRYEEYDAFVCVYHDQALLPIKMLAHLLNKGVISLTTGLSFLRISPAHGTAFTLANSSQCHRICSRSFDMALKYGWREHNDRSE